jgi:hypothetical protein
MAANSWMGGERGDDGGRAGKFIGRGAVSFTTWVSGGVRAKNQGTSSSGKAPAHEGGTLFCSVL